MADVPVIETLRIRNLAVVESAELQLGPGLNVLTGETGAGKSLVLGALALVAGGRASSDVVRSGATEAVVEAVLRSESLPGLAEALEAHGLAAEDGEVIVRRIVASEGRSRAFVSGVQVPIATLAALFGDRIEIASQHESQVLLRGDVQGRLLDAHGGLLDTRAAVERGVSALRAGDAEIARLREAAEERARREDFLAFQVKEIDDAGLEAGEGERLGSVRARLLHAERLRDDADSAGRCLTGDPGADDAPGASDLLGRARRHLEDLAGIDPSLTGLAERLQTVLSETDDLAAELERYVSNIESDPGRLAEIEDRLDRLDRLERKYGAGEEAVLAFRDRAAAELAEIGGADARLETLAAERAAQVTAVSADVATLSRGRKRAARALAKAVTEALKGLAIADARFEVALEPSVADAGLPFGSSGAESVELRFSANPGEEPRALRRAASGGELARLFLAVKNVLRRSDSGAVLVFDEVDTGIGGSVADRVGSVLAELAEANQVLCITHLPQIAARGRVHLRVHKQSGSGRALTEVESLVAQARVDEIARMAGGEQISEATRRHARALLEGARGTAQPAAKKRKPGAGRSRSPRT